MCLKIAHGHNGNVTNLIFSFIILSYDICPAHSFFWNVTVDYMKIVGDALIEWDCLSQDISLQNN